MASKNDIRRQISIFKHETETVMIDFAGDIIGYKVMALDEYKNADIVFIYADYNKEVKTDGIIEDALKKRPLEEIILLTVDDDGKVNMIKRRKNGK